MDSDYINKLKGSDREAYTTKLLLKTGEQLPDPFSLNDGWLNDITMLPELSWRDVTEYLIDTPSRFTKEAMKAYKSLEAYDYFMCGHVQDCFYHKISPTSDFCFIKSEVSACHVVTNASTF